MCVEGGERNCADVFESVCVVPVSFLDSNDRVWVGCMFLSLC